MAISSIASFLAGLTIGFLLVWVFARSNLHRRDADLAARESALGRAQQELSAAQQDRARIEAELSVERRAAAERETLLRDSFAALSQDALERNNRTFLDLAQTKLGEFQQSARIDLEGRHQAIADLVQPLKESLTRVDGKLHEAEKERAGSSARLDEQLRILAHTHQSLQVETNKLVRALRSPNQRGRWGEVQLRNVVERSGMQAEGIAEADPSLDLDGWDAAAKTAALANVLVGANLTPHGVRRTGIRTSDAERARQARAEGRRLKLVASAIRTGAGTVQAVVEPCVLAGSDLLASLDGKANALILQTDVLGEIAICQLEGSLTHTAYALLSDLITLRRRQAPLAVPARRIP